MIFQKISNPDNETIKLFIPYRKNFIYSKKSAIKQLTKIIHTSVAFYKVFDSGVFIGCLFTDCIDEENKIIEFGGFAKRHVNTKDAIKELAAYLKYHYPDYKIKAETSRLAAKFGLLKAGLIKKNGGYFYNE